MELKNISFDSLSSTIYSERYLNDSKGLFRDYSEVDERYDPQGNIPHVELPYTLLPHSRCVVYEPLPSTELREWVNAQGMYKFFWHPDAPRSELSQSGFVLAQPTGSTRTLLTEHNPHVYIKTDLDKKHFRFIRRLKRSSVEHSVSICNDLRQFVQSQHAPARYAFLPESLGVVVLGGAHEGSGVIYREVKPFPHTQEMRMLVPYHALYASDPNAPLDKPLLVQLVELHSAGDPLTYFVTEIIGPLLESWVTLVSQRGLLPELHGQNALAEIDDQFRLRRVVHRDFQGTYSDSRIRINKGLTLFAKHVAGSEPGTTIESQYSHVFDGMIGSYLVARLSKVFCLHFGIAHHAVALAIRNYHQCIPGFSNATFPRTVYRFGTPAHKQVGNDVQLVDSGEKPMFR